MLRLLVHGFFLVASIVTISLDVFVYRFGCVLVLFTLRVIWTQWDLWYTAKKSAEHGAQYGARLYRQATLHRHATKYQTDQDAREVGR